MSTFYWKNAAADSLWDNPDNWFADAAGTVNLGDVPWTSGMHLSDDLALATGESDTPILDSSIPSGVTGICSFSFGTNGSISIASGNFTANSILIGLDTEIAGGTFSGADLAANGSITGGVFSGMYLFNGGLIDGGTFTGDYLVNGSTILSGTFSGHNLANNNEIFGGTFTGDNTVNDTLIFDGNFSGSDFTNYGDVSGGVFSGRGFTNNGIINGGTFSGDKFNTSNGTIYGGTFSEKAVIGFLQYGATLDGTYGTITLTNESAGVLDVLGAGLN